MLGKYINQFMADNELSVNEEFFIENMDGNRVLIGCADRYKIEDVDGGILTAAVMNEKDKPPAMLLEAALIDLLRENYLVKKKPFYLQVGSSVCCGIHYGSPANWKLNSPRVIRLISQ